MAVNDSPNRIDEVFADGRLIDEALSAAAAEAVDRHRRGRVPLVVFRDGRIEHVPADLLVPDVDTLLTDAKFDEEHPSADLIAWFEARLFPVNRYRLVREAVLGHHERFKRLYPFALWLRHRHGGRPDVVCSLGSRASVERDCDAVVKDGASDPVTVTYVRLATAAVDRHESWRMSGPATQGPAPLWKPADVSQEERLRRTFDAIARAVNRTSGSRAGGTRVLVVSFDDFMWFGTRDDEAALTAFVSTNLRSWRLDVGALGIVGLSGRTFLSFPVPGG